MTPTNLLELPHADRAVARLRGGGTCTATELAAAVGPDTARFALLRARPGSLPALDLAVLSTATDANPAHRVRYAHARLCAVARHAAALGVDPSTAPSPAPSSGPSPEPVPGPLAPPPPGPHAHPHERELRDLVAGYERVVACQQPYPLARHLESVAEVFARVEVCGPPLPKGDEPVTDTHRARVGLCAAARAVLADGLRRLDVTAPEQM